jgi:hypothetical protein
METKTKASTTWTSKIFREHSILFQAFTEFSIDKNILLDFFSLKLDTQILVHLIAQNNMNTTE